MILKDIKKTKKPTLTNIRIITVVFLNYLISVYDNNW